MQDFLLHFQLYIVSQFFTVWFMMMGFCLIICRHNKNDMIMGESSSPFQERTERLLCMVKTQQVDEMPPLFPFHLNPNHYVLIIHLLTEKCPSETHCYYVCDHIGGQLGGQLGRVDWIVGVCVADVPAWAHSSQKDGLLHLRLYLFQGSYLKQSSFPLVIGHLVVSNWHRRTEHMEGWCDCDRTSTLLEDVLTQLCGRDCWAV